MVDSNKKKWNKKELKNFKTLILEKRNSVEKELEASREKADEVFVTGTAAEVTPVSQIGNYIFKPSSICKKMIEEYTKITLE